ncbi:tryptophan synthase subunit alpha [Methylolobus aquaticus]|nr:tryptophan synthase subunit alpha [Methylolobus aquaticus]
MSRIQNTFAALRESGRKALIPFLTAGDPTAEFTVPCMHAMVAAGADIIELGIPFSDPMADGPVIQRASERALAHKMSLRKTLALVEAFRRTDTVTPVVLMGYLNPIESLGYRTFVERAREVGVDGALTVDLPPEESGELLPLMLEAGLDPIFLLAPNSGPERVQEMSDLGRGYLYYVSLKGVTGASNLDLDDVERRIRAIKEISSLPVGVGFGVKNAEMAGTIARFADAVVVGSALVSQIEAFQDSPDQAQAQIVDILRAMREAMDASAARDA